MASCGKLEARITVPSGGWVMTIDTGESGGQVKLEAGTYYHSGVGGVVASLQETLEYLNGEGLEGVYTVALDAGEGGTGKYTISATGIASFSIAWTDPELQALLGFTSTPSGAPTYTGEAQAQALWISSYGHQKLNGGYDGDTMVSDLQEVVNSAGFTYGVMGQYYRTASIEWPQEKRSKTWTKNEVIANESFQTFLLDGIWGTAAWGTCLGPIRFYNDADDDTAYGTYSAMGLKSWAPRTMVEHWTGRWSLSLPQLIEVPGSRLDAANVAPVAGFTFEVDGLTATVTDTSTDSDGTIVSRSMDWGDGGSAETLAGAGPWEHEYASADTYTATLTVTDDGGLTDDFADDITVVVAYALDTLTPAQVATIISEAAPTLMWRGKDASGATELVAGTSNLSDIGSPDKEVVDTILDGTTTEIKNGNTDGMQAASSGVGDIGTGTLTWVWIGRHVLHSGTRYTFRKRDTAGSQNGYGMYSDGSGHVTFLADTTTGAIARTISAAHATTDGQVIMGTRQGSTNVQAVFSREGTSTGSRNSDSLTNTALLTLGYQGFSAAFARHGTFMIWDGADGDFADFAAARLAIATALGYE